MRSRWRISMVVGAFAVVMISRADGQFLTVGAPGQSDSLREALAKVKRQVAAREAILLDVREQQEWDAGHLELAKLLPSSVLRDPRAGVAAVAGLDKRLPVYLHCRRGRRAVDCAKVLADLGYNARPLRLRYEQLVEGGFKEQRPRATPPK